jgi:hypothetical protein
MKVKNFKEYNELTSVDSCKINLHGSIEIFEWSDGVDQIRWLSIDHCKDKKPHRENGPASEYMHGDKFWYLNGKHHREDGPAVERASGNKFWYLNGFCYPEDAWKIEVEKLRKSRLITAK